MKLRYLWLHSELLEVSARIRIRTVTLLDGEPAI
jgi:hypothetical protein